MSYVVYLIGHGRVDDKIPVVIPQNITMHWLGKLGEVSNGLSYAFLNGQLNTEVDQSPPGTTIPEHYLCGERADVDPVTDTKLKNFFDGRPTHPFGCTDPYALYPRGKTNISLSTIFAFFSMLSPTLHRHLYWTCCRGFIGQKNAYTSKFSKKTGTVKSKLRKDPGVTPELSDEDHTTIQVLDFQNVRLVAKSDNDAVAKAMTGDSLTTGIEKLMAEGVDPEAETAAPVKVPLVTRDLESVPTKPAVKSKKVTRPRRDSL